jgi:YfiH family protein
MYYPDFSAGGTIGAVTSLADEEFRPDALFSRKLCQTPPAVLLSQESVQWLTAEKIPLSRLVLARQVHGASVKHVTEPGIHADADGLFTDRKDLYLTIRTADCAAVLLYCPEVPAVGIAHAGWRGARANIVENLVQSMRDRWTLNPSSLNVAVSPHIKNCCYIVGEEFNDFFPGEFLEHVNGDLYFDLGKVLLKQLMRQNISLNNITVAPFCTACSEVPLYSYRKQKTAKRLLNIVSIKGDN